ncbi:MAG: RNB domain-containing ribonuclease [Elusimicrobiota bacterium]|nr:RNB domain-containing ribonuclease [Elusimicrobiota bacterium]
MSKNDKRHHRELLQKIAHRAMIERGLEPVFSNQVLAEVKAIHGPAVQTGAAIRNLRHLLWSSIDNDDSLDIDQLTAAESLPDGSVKIFVAIADVAAIVKNGTAIDAHAGKNTTSVYTAAEIFSMLPEKLSTDITSLNYESERLAIVIEMNFSAEGPLQGSEIYPAQVYNHAKLAYNSVAAWLDGNAPLPPAIGAVIGMEDNIRIQDAVAKKLKAIRHGQGALDFETIKAHTVFEKDELKKLEADTSNTAKNIVEEFMIATNGVTARYLASQKLPAIRRVVRTPKRWSRIVELAVERGASLPQEPDAAALEHFLLSEKSKDALRFPDLSLSVIKLLGAGEYVVEYPGGSTAGHFGLAVKDYAHSTAPNRRYPDLIIQRLLKAALAGLPQPYSKDELETISSHCTVMENAAKKVERQVTKSAAAMLLESRIGEKFDAIVTGASDKGVWVRLLELPLEGRLAHGYAGVDVGNRLRVKLVHTDVNRGFIDFKKI